MAGWYKLWFPWISGYIIGKVVFYKTFYRVCKDIYLAQYYDRIFKNALKVHDYEWLELLHLMVHPFVIWKRIHLKNSIIMWEDFKIWWRLCFIITMPLKLYIYIYKGLGNFFKVTQLYVIPYYNVELTMNITLYILIKGILMFRFIVRKKIYTHT